MSNLIPRPSHDQITTPAPDDDSDVDPRAEVHAIQVCADALAAIGDTDSQSRVVRYLVDRFKLSPLGICPRCRR
jgi:hypothetical protein